MPAPSDSTVTAYDEILTGHFREGRHYRTVRSAGSGDWLMILTLSGRGRFGSSSGDTFVDEGDIIFLPCGSPHDYGTAPSPGYWELVWAHFLPRAHWLPWLAWPEASPGMMSLHLEESVPARRARSRFLDCDRLARSPLRGGELLAMNALEEVILWCRSVCPERAQRAGEPRVEAARQYLRGHLAETVTLAAVASHVALSVSRLCELFAAEGRISPMQTLESLRMERARMLLTRTGQSVGRVAAEVGYDSAFYFSLRFKQATGQSPTEFRKSSHEAAEGS